MKVEELLVVLTDSGYEFYFDGELIENIKSVIFDNSYTIDTPATVKLEFEVNKVTIQNKLNLEENL
jgi:hypothetical protein